MGVYGVINVLSIFAMGYVIVGIWLMIGLSGLFGLCILMLPYMHPGLNLPFNVLMLKGVLSDVSFSVTVLGVVLSFGLFLL